MRTENIRQDITLCKDTQDTREHPMEPSMADELLFGLAMRQITGFDSITLEMTQYYFPKGQSAPGQSKTSTYRHKKEVGKELNLSNFSLFSEMTQNDMKRWPLIVLLRMTKNVLLPRGSRPVWRYTSQPCRLPRRSTVALIYSIAHVYAIFRYDAKLKTDCLCGACSRTTESFKYYCSGGVLEETMGSEWLQTNAYTRFRTHVYNYIKLLVRAGMRKRSRWL